MVSSIVAATSIARVARAEESAMSQNVETVTLLYERFNAKDIDGVLAKLSDDVEWANGMDGGYVHGHDGIRAYWKRQWSLVNPHVEPVHFDEGPDGSLVVEVKQTVRYFKGNPVQEKGLRDKTVGHIFHFAGAKVVRFDIREEE
jgi:ketosteroid isomerase-like protein